MNKTLLALAFSAISFLAQGQSKHENLYWIRWYERVQLTKNWTLHGEVDNRRTFDPDKQRQFISHIHLHYQFHKKANVSQGLTYSAVTNSSGTAVPEWRPFNELVMGDFPLAGKLSAAFRFRVEERFLHRALSDGSLGDGYRFLMRSRYRGHVSLPINPMFTARVGDEIMYHTGEGNSVAFDQNRLYTSMDIKLNDSFSFEMSYILLHQRSSGVMHISNVLRATIYHRFSLAKD